MIEIFFIVIIASFVLEFFDSSIGMGFGTLTPVLILLGFSPLEVIPAVLLCSSILSLSAGFMHHQLKNVNFFDKKTQKILAILLGFGVIGILIGAFTATHISEFVLDIYIGLLTLIMGIAIIHKYKIKRKISWKRIFGFGAIASFNKGISGGGFGPILSGGQIISGVKSKHAVGITSLTEGVLSTIGVASFLIFGAYINWSLILSLLIGGLASLPLAVLALKKFKSEKVRMIMGIISIILGISVILKILII